MYISVVKSNLSERWRQTMSYRATVRHVRYWRGKVKRWSTTWHFEGTPSGPIDSTHAQTVLQRVDALCYSETSQDGGTYECAIYDKAVGGIPVATYTAFDWTNPASWLPYSGGGWASGGAPFLAAPEAALLISYPAGLSKSGKPVALRKWIHAVKDTNPLGGAHDIGDADVASLGITAHSMIGILGDIGLTLGSGTGRFAGTPVIYPFYQNHQMVRGKRRISAKAGAAAYRFQVQNSYKIKLPPVEAN